MAVIHHPTHYTYMTDDLNDEDEDSEENQLPIKKHLSPRLTDPSTESATGDPDLSVPITIWRSESPMGKCQEDKVIKNIKKKKEKEKDKEEMVDEKANLKNAKGKLTKKKSPVKSESSPADLNQSVRPVRTSESSPESREGLESEESYGRGKERPFSENTVESSLPRKKEKSSAKKNGTKNVHTRKTSKRKSPPVPNPNFS